MLLEWQYDRLVDRRGAVQWVSLGRGGKSREAACPKLGFLQLSIIPIVEIKARDAASCSSVYALRVPLADATT
jgi:hypothetical protein